MTKIGDYWIHRAPGFTGTTLWKVIETDLYDCRLEVVSQIRNSSGELKQSEFGPGNMRKDFPIALLHRESSPWEFMPDEDLPLFYLGEIE